VPRQASAPRSEVSSLPRTGEILTSIVPRALPWNAALGRAGRWSRSHGTGWWWVSA
jgi:hypothetical protein